MVGKDVTLREDRGWVEALALPYVVILRLAVNEGMLPVRKLSLEDYL